MDHKQIPYPRDITADIVTTIAGLAYTYTEPPIRHDMNTFGWTVLQRPRVPRTKFSQFSAGAASYASRTAKSANERPELLPVVHDHVAQLHHWKPIYQDIAGLFSSTMPGYEYLEGLDMWKLSHVSFVEPASPDGTYRSPALSPDISMKLRTLEEPLR